MRIVWCVLMVVCFLTSAGFADSKWELFQEKDGVKAYKRQVKKTSFLETRSVSVIPAGIYVIANVLADVSAYSEWMYECLESPLIKQIGWDHRIIYFVQNAPWPAKDREVVIDALTVTDPENATLVTTLKSLKDYPYDSGRTDCVRVNQFIGKWELVAMGENKTLATYTAYSDPGGALSPAIANNSLKNITSVSMTGLKKMVKKSKYRVVKQEFVSDARSSSGERET